MLQSMEDSLNACVEVNGYQPVTLAELRRNNLAFRQGGAEGCDLARLGVCGTERKAWVASVVSFRCDHFAQRRYGCARRIMSCQARTKCETHGRGMG